MKEILVGCEKGFLENMAFIATIAVPVIALLAGIIAILQIKSSVKTQRRSTAYDLYQNYLSSALQNHVFAYGDKKAIMQNAEELAKYKWFVTGMLICFEEILESCPTESDWILTIKSQLRRHAWHLSNSSSIRAGHWKRNLAILIQEQIKIFENQEFGVRDAPKDPGKISFQLLY